MCADSAVTTAQEQGGAGLPHVFGVRDRRGVIMAKEIERKFKVIDDSWRSSVEKTVHVVQGYLSKSLERVVRVRTMDDRTAMITIKGITSGFVRAEYEYQIPIKDARELMQLCLKPLVEKTRHYVRQGDLVWEIDEFRNPQDKLVLAEIELPTADREFQRPFWVGAEVTGDPRFYNQNITFRAP
jgi:adenylate cyclase